MKSIKVTALIPNPIVEKVRHYAGGKTLTDSLVIALKDWIARKKIIELHRSLKEHPLQFKKGFSAEQVRSLNRSR